MGGAGAMRGSREGAPGGNTSGGDAPETPTRPAPAGAPTVGAPRSTAPSTPAPPAPGPASDRRLRLPADLGCLSFDERGLVPVVAQDATSGAVLMVAWANREALARSLESGQLHFWSRSRRALWRKGESSGNVLRVRALHADCDGDVVLALVDPAGPACHTGETTCFGAAALPAAQAGEDTRGSAGPPRARVGNDTRVSPDALPASHAGDDTRGGEAALPAPPPGDTLAALWRTLESRARDRPEGSYTTRLLAHENLRLKKLGEETAELVAALARGERGRVPEEAADLVYHLLVALLGAGTDWREVLAELERRRG